MAERYAAKAFCCHRNTVANLRQRFVEQGLEAASKRKPRLCGPRQPICDIAFNPTDKNDRKSTLSTKATTLRPHLQSIALNPTDKLSPSHFHPTKPDRNLLQCL